MEPLISVIVPVYNVAPFLREAVDSVINQTWRNLEIILVDDGSMDGSGEICDEYLADPRVKVIHQENRGLSGARNTGLDQATGEYIVFLDGDDSFHPEMIERLYQALSLCYADLAACEFNSYVTKCRLAEGNVEESIGFGSQTKSRGETTFSKNKVMIQAVAEEASENGKDLGADSEMQCAAGKTVCLNGNDLTKCKEKMRPAENKASQGGITILSGRETLCATAEGRFPMVAWNKLYTRRLWEDIRYPEGHVHEDVYVIPRLLEKCERVAVVSQPLVYYRKRKGSITDTHTVQNVQDNIAAYRQLLEYMEQIQPPLSVESIDLCRENALQDMISRWAEVVKTEGLTAKTKRLKEEILSLTGDKMHFQRIRSKVVWQMFLHLPGMVLPVRNGFQVLRHIKKTAKAIHSQ